MDKLNIGVGEINIGVGELQARTAAQTADSRHKEWINLLSVSQSITRPGG